MADDLSLLFKLRGDNAQAKAVMGDTRAAVTALRGQFGKDLTQMQGVARTAISDIGENVNAFVGQRIPLIGGVFQRVTSNLRGLNDELKKGGPQTAKLAQQIDGIAKASGKSTAEVSRFLTAFVRLEGQAKRDAAALEFVGAAAAQKLIPQLEQAGTQLAVVAGSAGSAGSALAGMATPIGIAVVALAAMALGAAAVAKQIFDLTKQAAAFQGRLADLSQQTNVSVEALSAMEVAIKQNGGEIGGVVQALVSFQRKLDDAQDPLSKTAEQFRKFNIAANDTESALRQAFVALAAMPPGFAQTNAAAELFGTRGGKNMLLILKQMGGDLDGAIAKLREMGIVVSDDAARAADTFNDELELLNFQIRALSAVAARDLIPAMIDVVRGMGELVRAVRPVVSLFSTLAGPVVRSVGENLKNLGIIVRTLTGDYLAFAESIKRAREESEIKPIEIPALSPVPLPKAPTPLRAAQDVVTQAEAAAAAVKRAVAAQGQAIEELVQKGLRSTSQQVEAEIALNKRILDVEQQTIETKLELKAREIQALDEAQRDRGEIVKRDTEDYRRINEEVAKLQQQRLDKESAFAVDAAKRRATASKQSADEQRKQIAEDTDLLLGELERQIRLIEGQINRGEQEEEDSLAVIEQLEQAKIHARTESLKQQQAIGHLTIESQRDLNNQIRKLNQDQDRLTDEQRERRLDRQRAAGQRERDIAIANIETLLSLEQIAGQRRIDTINALARLRVITEEEAAKQILKIRLDLIDDEIEATKEKLQAAGTIADKDERIRTQAELNNQIKVLTEERITIEADGFREIDEGRQRDLDNERRYIRELRSIREQINDIQRETARTVIDLMVLHHARRRDIIRAQAGLDIQEENDRHQRELDSIQQQEIENKASQRTQEEKLEVEKELNRQREAELERHRLEIEQIEVQQKRDEILAGPFGGLDFGLQAGQLAELQNGVQSFADVATVAFSAVGAVVNQLASGIGSLVQNFVLLGSNGPNAFRKLVASVLAGVAAQAATLAIMELAYGVAALTPWGAAIYGPAPFHFKSAALFGSIATIAGLAGRGVAGGLFQPGGGTGAGAGNQDRGQLNPLTLNRNQPQRREVVHIIRVESNDSHILETIGKNWRKAGGIRELVLEDA